MGTTDNGCRKSAAEIAAEAAEKHADAAKAAKRHAEKLKQESDAKATGRVDEAKAAAAALRASLDGDDFATDANDVETVRGKVENLYRKLLVLGPTVPCSVPSAEALQALQQLTASEQHFNQLQSGYRKLASTWAVAALGALAYISDSHGANPWMTFAAGLAGGVGVALLWLVDHVAYFGLLSANYAEALYVECKERSLPGVRRLTQSQANVVTVGGITTAFYVVLALAPGLGAALMLASSHGWDLQTSPSLFISVGLALFMTGWEISLRMQRTAMVADATGDRGQLKTDYPIPRYFDRMCQWVRDRWSRGRKLLYAGSCLLRAVAVFILGAGFCAVWAEYSDSRQVIYQLNKHPKVRVWMRSSTAFLVIADESEWEGHPFCLRDQDGNVQAVIIPPAESDAEPETAAWGPPIERGCSSANKEPGRTLKCCLGEDSDGSQ